MKVAVSLPDDVFQRTDRLARRSRRSRSEVVSEALREYLARHEADAVTAALDRALEGIGPSEDAAFVAAASQAVLEASEW